MLGTERRDRLAAALPDGGAPFALAFSGGGDSLSLLRLLADHPGLSAVLHVDHGLRDSSTQEAEQVIKLAAQLGHDVTILRWKPDEIPKTGLQEKARRARYRLLGDYCRAHGLTTIVTAHHADDQAETVMMRLDQATGWRGAAGMRPVQHGAVWPELAGVTLIRPALNLSRPALRSHLADLPIIDDPSNQDGRYTRIQARRYLATRPAVSADMLALSADMQVGLAREAAHMRGQLADYHLTHEGLLRVPRLVDAPTLAAMAPIIGGREGPPDHKRAPTRRADLESGKAVSLGHGSIGRWDGQTLILSRDPVAMTGRSDGNLEPTAIRQEIGLTPMVWDGRFMVRGDGGFIQPERRRNHVGFRILYGRNVRIDNLVDQRLQALLQGVRTSYADAP